jgi:UDP-N-acetylmuramyl pentapeptide phosphotransferase/UDP-N-acetylglucosamine-1-phosphate transferase
MIGNFELLTDYVNLGLLVVAAAIASAALIVALRPLLLRYALARPNVRSSHREPTPQGGGIAVIGATTMLFAGALIFAPGLLSDPLRLALVFASTVGLAVVGATDDIRPLEAIPRLLLQTVAVAVVIAALPGELHIIHALPWWLERALMLIAILWFVNLVNFMDGIDWMTVAEVVPVTAGLALFGLMGALPHDAMLVAIVLCGAIVGFAPFNRPVARLFLGDVGSLPIGLLLGWLLVLLGGEGHLAASLLLPLYYLADATITLLRRLVNGEQILLAHRSHFYQRAVVGDFSVYQIVGRVCATNIVLVGLAVLTLINTSIAMQVVALTAGSTLVGTLLFKFNRVR